MFELQCIDRVQRFYIAVGYTVTLGNQHGSDAFSDKKVEEIDENLHPEPQALTL